MKVFKILVIGPNSRLVWTFLPDSGCHNFRASMMQEFLIIDDVSCVLPGSIGLDYRRPGANARHLNC